MQFTKAARWRMLQYLATVDWGKVQPAVFITLTTHDDMASVEPTGLTYLRSRFWRWVEHELGGNVGAIWRIEWKLRQSGRRQGQPMPHWHFMAFNVRFLDCQKVNAEWKRLIGVSTYVRTEVKRMVNERQAGYYVAKYVAKTGGDCSLVNSAYLNKGTGRHWGILRPKMIARHDPETVEVDQLDTAMALMREAADLWPHIDGRVLQSFSLLGDKTAKFWQKLKSLVDNGGAG